MLDKQKIVLWGLIDKMPLQKYLASSILPLCMTIAFTIIIYLITTNLPFTLGLSVLVFFIILFIQHIMLAIVFGGKLHEFLINTKECHLVTRQLGAEILGNFITRGFSEGILLKGDSLPDMLRQIELEDGYPLIAHSYDILLKKAALMKPTRVLAVWDFEVTPIDRVYDPAGKLYPGELYFDILLDVYTDIKNAQDKQRVFVFKNEGHKEQVMSHKGWTTLQTFHKNAGFKEVYLCFADMVQSIRSRDGNDAAVKNDDFVYYTNRKREPWIIGRNRIDPELQEREPSAYMRETALLHGDTVAEKTLGMYERLVLESTLLVL